MRRTPNRPLKNYETFSFGWERSGWQNLKKPSRNFFFLNGTIILASKESWVHNLSPKQRWGLVIFIYTFKSLHVLSFIWLFPINMGIFYIPPYEEFYKLFIIFFQKELISLRFPPLPCGPFITLPWGLSYPCPPTWGLAGMVLTHNWKLRWEAATKPNHSFPLLSPRSIQWILFQELERWLIVIRPWHWLQISGVVWGTQICGHHSH